MTPPVYPPLIVIASMATCYVFFIEMETSLSVYLLPNFVHLEIQYMSFSIIIVGKHHLELFFIIVIL
uniref:Uncharacterized protein n=1 Tax=Kalanchoe fedtschenkoi TaxID=63787 RepID=A0A7N0UP51_KALFE